MSKVKDDPRIDPRIKAIFGDMPTLEQTDVESREALLAEANTEEAIAAREQAMAMFAMMDNDEVAPSAGLEITDHEFISSPDGNTIKVQYIRPDNDGVLPCCTTSTAVECSQCPASTACTDRGDASLQRRGLR